MIISVHPNGLVALVGAEDKNLDVFDIEDDPRLHQGFTVHFLKGVLTFEKSYQMLQDEKIASILTVKQLKDFITKK